MTAYHIHRGSGAVVQGARCSMGSGRPVVVIDPEDAEQVERLADLLAKQGAHRGRVGATAEYAALAAALRGFAAPTPPKPDEPQGLGAVVEDAAGVRWIRHDAPFWCSTSGSPSRTEWKYLAAVRVLSEGVTP